MCVLESNTVEASLKWCTCSSYTFKSECLIWLGIIHQCTHRCIRSMHNIFGRIRKGQYKLFRKRRCLKNISSTVLITLLSHDYWTIDVIWWQGDNLACYHKTTKQENKVSFQINGCFLFPRNIHYTIGIRQPHADGSWHLEVALNVTQQSIFWSTHQINYIPLSADNNPLSRNSEIIISWS